MQYDRASGPPWWAQVSVLLFLVVFLVSMVVVVAMVKSQQKQARDLSAGLAPSTRISSSYAVFDCDPTTLLLGITAPQAERFCGRPVTKSLERHRDTEKGFITKEQWNYGAGTVLLLEDGMLQGVAWQESR